MVLESDNYGIMTEGRVLLSATFDTLFGFNLNFYVPRLSCQGPSLALDLL